MHPASHQILESARITFSDVMPSIWAERNRIMPPGSSHAGPFSYDETPYTREIVDSLHPSCPAKFIAWMKAAQVGGSAGVIENGIGYTISERPLPILHTVGHESLIAPTVTRIDSMIEQCSIAHLIKKQNTHRRNSKTGNTDLNKQYAGGEWLLKIANHKSFAQFAAGVGMIDDYEKMKSASKESGDIEKLILARFTSYYHFMKIFYISTPELEASSNIEKVFKKGDQRYYNIHCPCCQQPIDLKWEITIEGTEEKAGIFFKTDNHNHLIESSVGYICQKCAGFFTDKNKKQLLIDGFWKPTAIPFSKDYRSYHTNALYAANFMFPWALYAQQYLECNPVGQPRVEEEWKTFKNLVLGETYKPSAIETSAAEIETHIRNYPAGIIPEKQSINDGNGRIVLITCSADMNGLAKDINSSFDDARLDYEVAAYAENGVKYSILHGSIGGFKPFQGQVKEKEDRIHYTYDQPANKNNTNHSVWPLFDEVLNRIYYTDTGEKRKIFITGLDTGHFTTLAYDFIDKTTAQGVYGLKGTKEDALLSLGQDVADVKKAVERDKLFIVQVNKIKDRLAEYMAKKWQPDNDDAQPPHFMNFPTPTEGMYTKPGFFAHYESERREIVKNKIVWRKKSSREQNHFWDIAVYNEALCSLWIYLLGIELNIKNFTWKDYVKHVKGEA